MTKMRSQFDAASERPSGYIAASLNFMVADTRGGLTAEAAVHFAKITEHAAQHSDRLQVAGYVRKMETLMNKSPDPSSGPRTPSR